MNRATFLKSLLALPFAGRAVLRANLPTKLLAPGPIAQPLTSWKPAQPLTSWKPAQSPDGTIDLLPPQWVEGYGMKRVYSPVINEMTTLGPQAVYMKILAFPYFVSSGFLQEEEALGVVSGVEQFPLPTMEQVLLPTEEVRKVLFNDSMKYLEKHDMRHIYKLYVSNFLEWGPQSTAPRQRVLAQCARSAERHLRGLEDQLRYAQSLVADGPSLKDILAS